MKKLLSIIFSLLVGGVVYSQCVITPFTNAQDTLNCGDSLYVDFTVYADLVLTEAFTNGGPQDTNWVSTSGAIYTNPYIPSPSNDPYFWMGTSPIVPTALTSSGFDVSGGGQVCFDFVYAVQGQPSPTEGPDEYDEGITVQYSIDGGLTWIDMVYYAPNGDTLPSNPGVNAPNVSAGSTNFNAWTSVCIDIPPGAMTTSTSFQWIQENHSSPNNDHWGLDNIVIATADPTYSIYNLNNGDSLGPAPVTHTSWITTDTIFNYMYTAGGTDTCYGSFDAFMNPTYLGPDVVLDCNTNIVNLYASGVSLADNYSWTPTNFLSNPTGISTFASPIDTTQYIFNSSCGSDSIMVNVISNYLFSISGDTTICVGDSAQLNVYGGAETYTWTPNNGTISDPTIANPLVSPLTTTDYIVETDSAGCLKTDTFTVTVSNKNFVLVIPNDADCNGNNTGSIISPGSGAAGPFEYYLSLNGTPIDTSSAPSFNNLSNGTYVVTYTDSMYCDIDTTIIIGGGVPVSLDTILLVNPLCVGATNGSIEVVVDSTTIDSSSVVNYSINGGLIQTSPIFTGLSDGTYLVSAQVGNCAADTQTVILSAPVTVEINFVDSTDLTCGGSGDGEIQVSSTNGVAPFQYSIDNVTFYDNGGVIDSLAAGSYTIYVMDANGCGDSLSTSISEPTPVAITNIVSVNPGCFNDSTGSITFDAINGLAPHMYSIDSGVNFVNTNSFPSLWDDNYMLMAQDANGCVSPVVFDTLVEPTQLVLVEDSTQSSTCGAADGIIYVSASGGTAGYTYSVNGGPFQTSGILTGVTSGSHTVICTDANGCSETINVVVSDNGAPTLSIVSADSVTCFGLADATVQLSSIGGIAPYQFSVNGSPLNSDSLFTNLGGGLQTFTVSDAIGCTGSVDTIIFEPSLLDVTASQDSTSCFGSANGNINLFGSAGTPPYLYAVDDTSTVQFLQTFSGYAAGTYMGYVIDMNGCIDSVAQTVLQADSLEVTNIVADSVVCQAAANGLISFDAMGGVAPYSYSIDGGTTFMPTNTFTVDTGSYSLTVQDASGCSSVLYPVNIYEPSDLVLDSITTTKANCGLNNGSLEVLASGGVAPYTYALNGGTSQNSGVFNNVAFMTHTIIVTDANNCTETINVFVDQNTNLTLSIVSYDSVSCGGAGDATVSVLGAGGVSPYYYTVNGGFPQTSATFANLSGGWNVFTFTDSIGNCTITDSVDIFEPNVLDVTASQDSVDCFGNASGNVNLFPTGGLPPYVYALNDISITQNPSTFANNVAGTYVGYVIDMNGCVDSVSQIVLQPDTLEVTTVAVNISCMANGSITVNPTGGTMPYAYSLNGGFPQTSNVFTITAGGNYTVSVTDANGCTPATATDSIVAPTPVVYAVDSITANLLCNGNTDGFIGVAASGGSGPYTYSLNGGPYQTDSFFNNLSAGTYSINVQDVFGCPSILTNHVIAEPAMLSGNLSSTSVSCFGLADGTILVNNISGGVAPYNVTVSSVVYPFTVGLTVPNLAAGNYNVLIEDANLCSILIPISVADVTPVNLALDNSANVSCYGVSDGEIEVSATGGTPIYTFELFTASSSSVITNNSSATFTGIEGTEVGISYPILVTDANGCKDSLTHIITQPANLIIDSLSASPESCFGYYDGVIATHVSGGSAPYTYSWAPTGYANVVADGLTSGLHTVTVTDANGCSVSASETLPAIDPILADITPDSASISMGDTLQLGVNVQNAVGTNLQYAWSPTTGLSCTDCENPTVTVYNDISYSVVVTDENGCMSYNQTEVYIGVDASLFFFIPNGFTPNGDGINDVFEVYGQDVKTVDMMVFNRWGEKVFEGTNQFETWDGTYKGVPQSPGAFTYVIDVTFLNDAQVNKKGSVSLVR